VGLWGICGRHPVPGRECGGAGQEALTGRKVRPGIALTSSQPIRRGAPAAPARLSWARLLKRAFNIDIEHCPHCGGPLKIIAAIEHPSVIAKIRHLGLSARAPPRSPARSFDRFQMA
jgi:hypothetical protein